MIVAHKVRAYAEDGGGHKWCLLDTATAEFVHGGLGEELADVVLAWAESRHLGPHLGVALGPECTMFEFAQAVMDARRALGRRPHGRRREGSDG